jgi:hypothetical protein
VTGESKPTVRPFDPRSAERAGRREGAMVQKASMSKNMMNAT